MQGKGYKIPGTDMPGTDTKMALYFIPGCFQDDPGEVGKSFCGRRFENLRHESYLEGQVWKDGLPGFNEADA
jgi:hypothetical protein